jgi:hypothetical protein
MITHLHKSINIACQQVTGINSVIYFHIAAFPIPAPAFPIPAPAFPYTGVFLYFHEANNSVQAPGE